MADPLTLLPIEQRRKFCELLLADQIDLWIVFNELIFIVHSHNRLCSIDSTGKVRELEYKPQTIASEIKIDGGPPPLLYLVPPEK